jgi:hypothetical protein
MFVEVHAYHSLSLGAGSRSIKEEEDLITNKKDEVGLTRNTEVKKMHSDEIDKRSATYSKGFKCALNVPA